MKIIHVYRPSPMQLIGVTFTPEEEKIIRTGIGDREVAKAQRAILDHLGTYKKEAWAI